MKLNHFALKLGGAFALPWLFLVVIPQYQLRGDMSSLYYKERDGMTGSYPPIISNKNGREVYLREGCANCHTQMIRPTNYAFDGWKKGWGSDQSARPEGPARPSTSADYYGEPIAPLGNLRIGPDLANVGYRLTDLREVHLHLYNPRITKEWSVMPAFSHLYIKRPIKGQPAASALKLDGLFSPPKGTEVVPTPEAEALVTYLMSLKKDFPVPGVSIQVEGQKTGKSDAIAPAPAKK